MTTYDNEVPQHLQDPFKSAVRQWRRAESPDQFETNVSTETEQGSKELTVSIYHHETFPLGG